MILFVWSFGLTLGAGLIIHPHLGGAIRATTGRSGSSPSSAFAVPLAGARREIAAQDLQRVDETFTRDRRRHIAQSKMRRGERDTHTAADQHHARRGHYRARVSAAHQ